VYYAESVMCGSKQWERRFRYPNFFNSGYCANIRR
jgi:hypothetical protein